MKKALIWGPMCEFRTAFADGLRRHGWTVDATQAFGACDLLVMWGVKRRGDIERQRMLGREVCILERGYLADRYAWTSVSFGGGLNGRGDFRGDLTDGSRWGKHFAHLMRP